MANLTDKLKSPKDKDILQQIGKRLKDISKAKSRDYDKPFEGGVKKLSGRIYVPSQGYVPFPGRKYGH